MAATQESQEAQSLSTGSLQVGTSSGISLSLLQCSLQFATAIAGGVLVPIGLFWYVETRRFPAHHVNTDSLKVWIHYLSFYPRKSLCDLWANCAMPGILTSTSGMIVVGTWFNPGYFRYTLVA